MNEAWTQKSHAESEFSNWFHPIDTNADGFVDRHELEEWYGHEGAEHKMQEIHHEMPDHISWDEWWCFWGGHEWDLSSSLSCEHSGDIY